METKPAGSFASSTLAGVLCGMGASLGWAVGFVAAKHGVGVGFTPADLAVHRYVWTGLLMLPLVLRGGIGNLGGLGWGRGIALTILSGPPQAILAYTGFILVPLGHGTTIQPACAALTGLILATLILGEPLTVRRIIGGIAIVAGLIVFGGEALTTIGPNGVGGDLLFVAAGMFWATFGTLLRLWHVSGTRAATVVTALSALLFAPAYVVLYGFDSMLRMSLWEHLIQIVAQGVVAGVLPIYLFARAIVLIGAGRTATFPALVPGFSLVIGYLALGVVPSIAQLIGLGIVLVGFRFTLMR
ncbi:MAG TPA: DMT family transporter [Pseudolabrys sp.]|nr:DMT family transporter [Pseudolabrys sp.]